jgi:thiol-disulfide isomerase/thioredoxin
MFICNHCPYVKHINKPLTSLSDEYLQQNIRFIAINANDIESYPDDSPENMKKIALSIGYPFPYLYDETQEVAKAYQAACTPDFYIFNQQMALVYRGQFDNSRPGNNLTVDGSSLREAIDCLISNLPVNVHQKPSMGCNIKWKA